jgi:hypothetical protein
VLHRLEFYLTLTVRGQRKAKKKGKKQTTGGVVRVHLYIFLFKINKKSRFITEPAHHLPEPPELSWGTAAAAPRVKELKECDPSYDIKLL